METQPLQSSNSRPRHRRRLLLFGAAGLVVIAGVLYAYLGTEIRANEPKATKAVAAVPVSVSAAVRQSVPFRIQTIGNVEPFATVSLKARVDGQIVEVGFKEGEEVKKGSVLFRIDPRPYEAAMRQAEANFLRDTAQKIRRARRSSATRNCWTRISFPRRPTRRSAPTRTPRKPEPRRARRRSTAPS